MKIVYCLNSISYIGGIEKITITKAGALAKIDGNEVFVIVTDHFDGVTKVLPSKVNLIDLDIDYYADDWKSHLHMLKGVLVKRLLHKKRLNKILSELSPDVVISVGQSEKYFLTEIKGNWVTIREFHYPKDYRQRFAPTFIKQILAWLTDFYDYNYKIKQYNHIVVLTHEDKNNNWKKLDRVSVIPNPLTFQSKNFSLMKKKEIISVGRLAEQKNYVSLIRAFRMVVNLHPDWILKIYGEGSQKNLLQSLIMELQLENHVWLCGVTSQIQEKMCEASFFVSSSKFEGLPLAQLEAMSCGLPVVSYACPTGPKDIIDDSESGFLVTPDDERMLSEKICYLIEHPDKLTKMGTIALKKSESYTLDKIIPMWMNLFEQLINKKEV